MEWRKASYSAESGNCVEVAADGSILARDTQDREGVTLSISAGCVVGLARPRAQR
jgi:hypothetical protein